MNVTLRQLRIFVSVARHGSFSRAGDEIGLTQSAVSRGVRELEGELGLRLMDRTTRDVQLTGAGLNLQATAARLLTDLDGALREIREIGEQRRGRVVVAASPTVSARLMPVCLALCEVRYPFVSLVLRDDVQQDVIARVRSGEADFGVIIGPFESEDLIVEDVMRDSFVLICRSDHPLAARTEVDWQALSGIKLVMLDRTSGSRPVIDRLMRQRGVDVHIVQELAQSATVFGLVEAGVGLSVLPSLSLPLPADASLVAIPLVPRGERTIARVRRRARSLSPAADAVWSLVGEWRDGKPVLVPPGKGP
ncbi:LysR substrate-binding domain-containing protein [Robbsia sp. Bb-Pol-6]|uniref:LysR substrate-binding domain-containing protein n=1 Tax=Robbsia betulipollinis TaxID=2981849 RepID=A0ABT3ZJ80_9BURK|nr:LysR family transcriptional regulator [Robbsia betulipollinis]MCY0386417.1 LysR substrate-binding domain-containing protein [Robbsia betulipollinis]